MRIVNEVLLDNGKLSSKLFEQSENLSSNGKLLDKSGYK